MIHKLRTWLLPPPRRYTEDDKIQFECEKLAMEKKWAMPLVLVQSLIAAIILAGGIVVLPQQVSELAKSVTEMLRNRRASVQEEIALKEADLKSREERVQTRTKELDERDTKSQEALAAELRQQVQESEVRARKADENAEKIRQQDRQLRVELLLYRRLHRGSGFRSVESLKESDRAKLQSYYTTPLDLKTYVAVLDLTVFGTFSRHILLGRDHLQYRDGATVFGRMNYADITDENLLAPNTRELTAAGSRVAIIDANLTAEDVRDALREIALAVRSHE